MPRRLLLAFLVAYSVVGVLTPAAAQTPTPPPPGPIYIVQPNEYLSTIAERFNVSINDLMAANGITDANLISQGQRLIIPGLQGINGILDTEVVHFGDSFRSVVRRTQISLDLLQRLNHVVSPTEFYVGAAMIVPKQEDAQDLTARLSAAVGQSLLEVAAISGTDPWTLTAINGLDGTWDALPDDVLYNRGSGPSSQGAAGLPPDLLDAQIPTLPLAQGSTAEIVVTPAANVSLGGSLGTYPLHFFPTGDGRMVALQGIHAMLPPGVYPLQLDATASDSAVQSFQQLVVVNSGGYPKEALSVPLETIDPAITGPEDAQVLAITEPASAQRYWSGQFELPVGMPPCIMDRYGTRRSFNGSGYDYFHSGLDYGVCSADHPFDIYAAAAGVVVFAGPLNVRGNATFIDHGWGIYTAYFHQRAIHVSVGEHVQAGQMIGEIGDTGRVTGPHLHFEVWAGNIQVNPLDWLGQAYP